jgi:hypothetical protein
MASKNVADSAAFSVEGLGYMSHTRSGRDMLSRAELEYHSIAMFMNAIHRELLVDLQSLGTSLTLMPIVKPDM